MNQPQITHSCQNLQKSLVLSLESYDKRNSFEINLKQKINKPIELGRSVKLMLVLPKTWSASKKGKKRNKQKDAKKLCNL